MRSEHDLFITKENKIQKQLNEQSFRPMSDFLNDKSSKLSENLYRTENVEKNTISNSI